MTVRPSHLSRCTESLAPRDPRIRARYALANFRRYADRSSRGVGLEAGGRQARVERRVPRVGRGRAILPVSITTGHSCTCGERSFASRMWGPWTPIVSPDDLRGLRRATRPGLCWARLHHDAIGRQGGAAARSRARRARPRPRRARRALARGHDHHRRGRRLPPAQPRARAPAADRRAGTRRAHHRGRTGGASARHMGRPAHPRRGRRRAPDGRRRSRRGGHRARTRTTTTRATPSPAG
jgi:hypothetical protein